eukprot:g4341.t1
MSFPWMTNTQIQQSTGLSSYKDHKPHMRSTPTKPTSKSGIHDARGSRRWDEWNRQKVGGMSKIGGGNAIFTAAPTSTAESRLLPAGRNKLLHVGKVDADPKQYARRVPRRNNENPVLRSTVKQPDGTAYKPPTLSTRVGIYGTEPLPNQHKTVLPQPRYDPVNHKYAGNVHESAKASPIFLREGKRRLDPRIVPGNLTKDAPYSHYRNATGNILNNQVSAEAEVAALRLNSWKFEKNLINERRDACMSSKLVQEVLDQKKPFAATVDDKKIFGGLGVNNEIGMNDTAVSGDAPKWMVGQAKRANPHTGVVERKIETETFQTRLNTDIGTVADNSISGENPDWIVNATNRIDPTTIILRKKKAEGVRSTFYDDRGNEISDSAVSGDAPKWLTEANRRIDEASIVKPPEFRKPWHNRSPRKVQGKVHPSQQSSKTNWEKRPGKKIDFANAPGHSLSTDAPKFMVSSSVRSRVEAEKYGITPPGGNPSKVPRPNWFNRMEMGGDRGKVVLINPKDGVDKWVAGHIAEEDAKYEKILGSQTHMAKDGQLRTAAKTRPAGAYDTERANHVKRQERWR